jgi:hypothetical protein
MIMVTNKKSEKQMAEDLELFLGGLSQASSFSAWLHSSIRGLSSTSSNTGMYIYDKSNFNYKKIYFYSNNKLY